MNSRTVKAGDAEYIVLEFDGGGYFRESTDATLKYLRDLLRGDSSYTDVIILSHGWLEQRDSEGAIGTITRVVSALQDTCPAGVKPLYVAISWPSAPSTFFDRGSNNARKELEAFMERLRKTAADGVQEQARAIRLKHSSDSTDYLDAALERATTLFEKLKHKTYSFLDKEDEIQDDLPDEFCEDAAALIHDLGDDAGEPSLLDDGARYAPVTKERVAKCFKHVDHQINSGEGETARSLTLGLGIVGATIGASVAAVGAVGAIAAWKTLYALQELVFGMYERRAARVGGRGVHAAIAKLMQVASPSVRFSLIGHSLGSHVVQAAAIGFERSLLSRKLHTVMLGQGACIKDVVARGGPYRPLVSQLRPVAGPILATVFDDDKALLAYDIWLPDPIGRHGFTEVEPFDKNVVVVRKLSDDDDRQEIFMKKNTCYTLECSKNEIIKHHGNIDAIEVVRMFWQAVLVRVDEEEYQPTDQRKLPSDYWEDYGVRTEKLRQSGVSADCCMV